MPSAQCAVHAEPADQGKDQEQRGQPQDAGELAAPERRCRRPSIISSRGSRSSSSSGAKIEYMLRRSRLRRSASRRCSMAHRFQCATRG